MLAAWDEAAIALADRALAAGDAAAAVAPDARRSRPREPRRGASSAGQRAELYLALGDALAAAGDRTAAAVAWQRAAVFTGDFSRWRRSPTASRRSTRSSRCRAWVRRPSRGSPAGLDAYSTSSPRPRQRSTTSPPRCRHVAVPRRPGPAGGSGREIAALRAAVAGLRPIRRAFRQCRPSAGRTHQHDPYGLAAMVASG